MLRALQVDAQITHIQSAQEQRLNNMAPSARQTYNNLIAEQASLLAEAGRFEDEGAELGAALAAAEGELSRNGFKQRVLEVQVRWPGCF
jgi:peptidoglycan hydrolase CwlO-like protein